MERNAASAGFTVAFSLGAGQSRNHQLEEGVGLLLHRLGLQAAQGVRRDGHGQLRHPQGTALNLPQGPEKMGAHGYRRDAPPLQLDRVVDTPRRAGASIPQTDDHRLDRGGQLVQHLLGGWNGGGRFPAVHHAGDLILLAQQLLQPGEEDVAVRLAVPEEPHGVAHVGLARRHGMA